VVSYCVCVFVCDGNMQHACVYLNVRCATSDVAAADQ